MTTQTPDRPDPYAVELALAAALARITDSQTADITQAWARAWSEVSADLLDALAEILTAGGRVNTMAVVRYQRLARVLAVVADQLEDLVADLGVRITDDLSEVLAMAEQGTEALIAAQLVDRDVDVLPAPPDALTAIVERTTQQVISTAEPVADETYAIILRELTRGVAAGDNPRETAARMVERAEDLHNFGRARAENIARTETLDAHREAARVSQDANAEVLAGWVWLAHLGPRTCRSCLSMHGRFFELDVPGPHDHQQGRCSRTPVVAEEDGSFDLSWVPSASEHFEQLTPEQQKALLGRKGYDAWVAGDFDIDQWTKNRLSDDWRDSQVPAAPGDDNGGSVGGGNPPAPPTGGDGDGPDEPDDPLDATEFLAQLAITFPDLQQIHILDGDERGGGHLHGTNPTVADKPTTWFPEEWDRERCLEVIRQIVADPKLARWANSDRQFINVYGEVDRARIKIRISPGGVIITGHPIDGDGILQIRLKKDGTLTIKSVPYGRSREVEW